MLARNHNINVVATDILPDSVGQSKQLTDAQGLTGLGLGKVHSEVQDGRQLAYADNTFDAAFSVSVLEHIPDDGDSQTIKELVRVVKPGGHIVVTVPYGDDYSEDWVERDVYERQQVDGSANFYQRHYDGTSLKDRLLTPANARVISVELWGESNLPIERWLDRSRSIRRLLSPFEPMLAILFLHRVENRPGSTAMAAFFTLEVLNL